MFHLDYQNTSWRYWLVTVCLLTIGVSGRAIGFGLAICLTVIQIAHSSISEKNLLAFPVQVKLGYLLVLLIALPEKRQWMYWIPTFGTWAQVLFGYCLMARTVSLLPWNRKQSLSFALLTQTYFSAPVKGNILQGLPLVNVKLRHPQ